MDPGALACIVSPNPRDAELAVEFLGRHGIAARAYPDLRGLASALDERVGCVVMVEEAMAVEEVAALQEALAALPAWSDLPLVVVAHDVAAFGTLAAQVFPRSGNVTLLERPLNPYTLASAVTVALRASARQREVAELLAERGRAVALRDEFLAMLAHELRNPLVPMRNAVYLIQAARPENPMVEQATEILERQVTHVVRMVDDLMDVARMERGKVSLQRQVVDLNRVVAAAVETVLPQAQQRGHRVEVDLAAGKLPVDADPVRLEQVVGNLLHNAAKFSPRPGPIFVRTASERGEAVVAVQDRGVGFDPAAAGKLFDPFLQVTPSLERTAGGLGMGLTIVKRLTELHGGNVRAESEGPGKGARFEIRLPLAPGALAEAPGRARAAVNGRRRRVVVIEDNPDIRETLRLLLKLWGHEVELAADGPTGLDLVLKNRPDVALVDVGLPGMNGYDVARAVRRQLPPESVQLVAVTGYGQPADREQALQAGFNAHLLKPIAPDALREMLAR